MRYAHTVALNGAELDEVDDRIIVAGVSSGAGRDQIQTANAYGRDGGRVTSRRREYMEIAVTFSIRAKKNQMADRSEIFDAVMAWAAIAQTGAWLTTGQKPDQRAYVIWSGLPPAGDPWNWTSSYTITFRAVAIPYWQDASETTQNFYGSGAVDTSITVPGSARTPISVSYRNIESANATMVNFGTGLGTMWFTGMRIPIGSTFTVDYTDQGIQRIRIDGVSAFQYRSPASADDVMAAPGVNALRLRADRAGSWTVSYRGRWL